MPLCLLIGALGGGVAALALTIVPLFPDALPARVLLWIGVGVAATASAVVQRAGRRGVVAVLAAVMVLGMCAVKVNSFYGYRPTLAAALGIPAQNEVSFGDLVRTEPAVTAPAGVPLATVWHSTRDMPHRGRITRVDIPGTASKFVARQGVVYLPPAYLSSTRPLLPLLVLVPGQPGGPEDWLLAGRLAAVMDKYAAAHDGLAPVVVVPDTTGSALGNPLCLDSRLGNAETYLAVDVPAWAEANLQVARVGRAIGGFSFGGTCALQLAVRRPDVYPTFLDISGQAEPTLGDRAGTVAATFGGDDAAFRKVNPLDELAAGKFPGSVGVLTVGADDPVYRPEAEQVVAAAQAAGMTVSLVELPGQHTWALAGDALTGALPLIAARTGLAPSP